MLKGCLEIWKLVSRRSKALLLLLGVLLVVSAVNRQARGVGADFLAYYRGAELLLAGENPYTYFDDFNFKYAPSSLLFFAPLSILPFEVARWVFTILHLMMSLTLPFLLVELLLLAKKKDKVRADQIVVGLFLGFLASLRFIDEEYLQSQFGLPILWGMLLGIRLYLKDGVETWRSHAGIVVLSLFSQVKIHSLVIFVALTKFSKFRQTLKTAIWALIPALLPWPILWINWQELMIRSTPDIIVGNNLQGFFPFTKLVLGWPQSDPRTLYFVIPLFLLLFVLLPRFSRSEAQRSPRSFLLTVATWMIFGIIASPLPWRYTYSVLWIWIAVLWSGSGKAVQALLVALSLFLALTPSGILGKEVSVPLERAQSIFWVVLCMLILLILEARRSRNLRT